MENWTDKAIKQHIEELIEETYLQSLTEPEIRNYLWNFVKSCEAVLDENISIHGDIRITRLKIALLRSYLFINEKKSPKNNEAAKIDVKSRKEYLAQHVVHIKSTIIKLLDMINPDITGVVFEEHKKRQEESRRQRRRKAAYSNLIIPIGYYVLLFFAIIVLWIVVLY